VIGILTLVALLMGCTVEAKGTGDAGPPGETGATGPQGVQGVPGVPCAGCVKLGLDRDGSSDDAPRLRRVQVTAPKIAAGAVTAPRSRRER